MRKKITTLTFLITLLILPDAFGESQENSFIFTAAGDFGAGVNTKAVLEKISRSGTSFHLAVGDMSYNRIKPEKSWCDYIKAHLKNDIPFEVLSGNHEENSQHGLIDNFAQCLPDRLGAVGNYGKEYYFDYPANKPIARFILISPGLDFAFGGKFEYRKGDTHYQWLSKSIDEAKSSGIRWIVVGMHKNFLSAGTKLAEIDKDVFNLLLEKQVDLILQGHDHNYQRTKALRISAGCPQVKADVYEPACVSEEGGDGIFRKGRGSIVMIIGTGGESIYPVKKESPLAPYFETLIGNPRDPTYGFGRFTVSEKELSAEFIPSRKSPAGAKFRDSFRIVRDGADGSSEPSKPSES